MSQFKRLVEKVLWMHQEGLSESEIGQQLQIGRTVVEYFVEMYDEAADVEDEAL